jgi:hypothetical protein
MRLMLGTHRPEGVALFRDVQGAVEREEFKTRREAKEAHTNQFHLFSSDDYAQHEQGQRGVGCRRYQDESEAVLCKILAEGGSCGFAALALKVMERFPMRETHVKDLCVDMRARGLIDYELKARAKKPNASTLIWLSK